MLEIKLILCPIDFSEFSVRAYCHALSLAEHYRSKLVVQHIVEVWRHPCLQPELIVDQGTAPDMILSFAQAQKSDLIVMGTHGLRGFDRTAITGQGDRRITRSVADPSIRRGSAHDSIAADQDRHHLHHLGRILACTDFSEDSDLALNHAISAAAEYDAELTLLHVHVLEEVPRPSEMEEAIAVATEQLENLIPPERRKTLKIKTAVRTGKPYREIIQLAQEAQTDLVSGSARPWCLGSGGIWFDNLSGDAVGTLPVLTAHV